VIILGSSGDGDLGDFKGDCARDNPTRRALLICGVLTQNAFLSALELWVISSGK